METTPHILVVDDHEEIRTQLARYLSKNGMRATTASGGTEMREKMKATAPDLVVLDVMMPGEDGLSLCRYLRDNTSLPVILLTAMAEDTDRIVGLEVGADDYVTKPFNPRELLARIKAVLRRTNAMPRTEAQPAGDRLQFDRWTLDVKRRELTGDDGVSVALSTAEYRLLNVFLQRPGMVLSRDQLLDLAAGREAAPFDRAITTRSAGFAKRSRPTRRNPS